MKKSLIALAVLAASGAAFAQSTVTLYGVADVWFGSVKQDNREQKEGEDKLAPTQTVIDDGGVGGSRWGVKGSEDLGGGLKANFLFEQGFKIDKGTAKEKDKAFARKAYVGFSGEFGEVRLGFTPTAYDDVSGSADVVFGSSLSPMGNVFRSDDYTGDYGNTVYYVSPSFSGLTGAASYTFGEDKKRITDPATNKVTEQAASNIASFALSYENGPMGAQLGYQTEKNGDASKKFTRLGGSYDLGIVKASLAYGRTSNVGISGEDVVYTKGAKTTEWQLGLDYPVSPALTLSVGYARSKDNQAAAPVRFAGVTGAKRAGWGLGAKYDLSKRTAVYGGYEADTTKVLTGPGVTPVTDLKGRVFAVGVNHKF